jgi:hypothetical protein
VTAHAKDVALVILALFVAAEFLLVLMFLLWVGVDERRVRHARRHARRRPGFVDLHEMPGFAERPASEVRPARRRR